MFNNQPMVSLHVTRMSCGRVSLCPPKFMAESEYDPTYSIVTGMG